VHVCVCLCVRVCLSYGDNRLQMINVTYVGDTLIAIKVTGDVNVPRGQTSFTARLEPGQQHSSNTNNESSALALGPSSVSRLDDTTTTTTTTESQQVLARYAGKGQIAKAGFNEHRFVEGQLILFDNHHYQPSFSFVWIPSRYRVHFCRPTPEQTIALLRDTISQEDELENMRDYLTRCFDMDRTDSLARYHSTEQHGPEPFRRIAQQLDLEALQMKMLTGLPSSPPAPPIPEANSIGATQFNFWNVHKWRQYIVDSILADNHRKSSKEEEQA
jgi:Cyclin D1 binding domain